MALSRRKRRPSDAQSGTCSGPTRGTAMPVCRRMCLTWRMAGPTPSGAASEEGAPRQLPSVEHPVLLLDGLEGEAPQ
eukprot:10164016-Alexandrium_andersonii.AAC.1